MLQGFEKFLVRQERKYPPYGDQSFEEFFLDYYKAHRSEFDRELIPVNWTGVLNNNGPAGLREDLRKSIMRLPPGNWLTVSTHDLAPGKVPRGTMSFAAGGLGGGIPLPLVRQGLPEGIPIEMDRKDLVASFIGRNTHETRQTLRDELGELEGYRVDFTGKRPPKPEDFDRMDSLLRRSKFALCPRGYGPNSFRIAEAMAYGCVPVIIGEPPWMGLDGDIPWWKFSIWLPPEKISSIPDILSDFDDRSIYKMAELAQEAYHSYLSYEFMAQTIKKRSRLWEPIPVAMSVCDKDCDQALSLAKHIACLGGFQDADVYLMVSRKIEDRAQELVEALKKCSRDVIFVGAHDDGDLLYPKAANRSFKVLMTEAAKRNGGRPIMWLEPDCVPMRPDWYQDVCEEYWRGGNPFCGPVHSGAFPFNGMKPIKFMNGTGIYPNNFMDYMVGNWDQASTGWDSWFGNQVAPYATRSRLWQHYNPKKDTRTGARVPRSFRDEMSICEYVYPETAIYHRCKDLTLSSVVLNHRYPYRRPVEHRANRSNVCSISRCYMVRSTFVSGKLDKLKLPWEDGKVFKRKKYLVAKLTSLHDIIELEKCIEESPFGVTRISEVDYKKITGRDKKA